MHHALALCWLQQQNMSFGSAFVGFLAGCWWDCSSDHCGCAQEATSSAHQLPHPQRHPECCCSRGGCAQAVLPHGNKYKPSIALGRPAASVIVQGWLVVRRLVHKATSPSLAHHPYVELLRTLSPALDERPSPNAVKHPLSVYDADITCGPVCTAAH